MADLKHVCLAVSLSLVFTDFKTLPGELKAAAFLEHTILGGSASSPGLPGMLNAFLVLEKRRSQQGGGSGKRRKTEGRDRTERREQKKTRDHIEVIAHFSINDTHTPHHTI